MIVDLCLLFVIVLILHILLLFLALLNTLIPFLFPFYQFPNFSLLFFRGEIVSRPSTFMNNHVVYDLTDRSAYIQELYGPTSEQEILTVEQTKEFISKNHNQLIHFEGVIEKKLFALNFNEPYDDSRPYGFGTNGNFLLYI